MKIYLDTSFLVSLYGSDVNLEPAIQVMQASEGDHLVTTFGRLEVVNAFALQVFRKEASAAQARFSMDDFERDLRSGVLQLRSLTEQALNRARELARQTTAMLGTRTADLLHVAAALELEADYLYSFDKRQRELASFVHLDSINTAVAAYRH